MQPMGRTTVKQITIMQAEEEHAGTGTFPGGSTSHRQYMWDQGKSVRERRD